MGRDLGLELLQHPGEVLAGLGRRLAQRFFHVRARRQSDNGQLCKFFGLAQQPGKGLIGLRVESRKIGMRQRRRARPPESI